MVSFLSSGGLQASLKGLDTREVEVSHQSGAWTMIATYGLAFFFKYQRGEGRDEARPESRRTGASAFELSGRECRAYGGTTGMACSKQAWKCLFLNYAAERLHVITRRPSNLGRPSPCGRANAPQEIIPTSNSSAMLQEKDKTWFQSA